MKDRKRERVNLLTQVQFYKNYSEHRQRLHNRYRSPIQIKKSMSFDPQKTKFVTYVKQRKQYTNQFNKKQQANKAETSDAIMLKKILEYNQKLFVFSLKNEIPKDGLLHHNAKVNNNRTYRQVDLENAKIFNRIEKAKAKSIYSQDYLRSSRFSTISKTSLLKKISSNIQLNHTTRNPNKMYTEYQQEGEQETQKHQRTSHASQFSNPHEVRRFLQDSNIQKAQQQQQQQLQFKRSNFEPPNIDVSSNRKILCDRQRKERLAIKLYQKKMKFQNTIFSRIIGNRK